MSKTQIRGPQKQGAHELDTPVAAMVVNSYARATTEEAKRFGQAAAAAILPLRRALWALAERLVPERLAAALRARSAPGDPTGRDGVRELRLAVADWLDPPAACRWCRRPMRPGEPTGPCPAAGRRRARPARAAVVISSPVIRDAGVEQDVRVVSAARRAWSPRGPVECRPSAVRRATGAVERCGTLALYPAGSVDLATMAAAIRTKVGAATGYDVAADRDLLALTAACSPLPPRDVTDPDAWASDSAWRVHAAVAEADAHARRPGVPAQVLAAVGPLQAARQRNLLTNGRTGIAVQLRYHSPRDGVTRADLTQGTMVGLDRGALDYDDSQARFTTYAAAWARQGCGEAWARRDLVGVPPWVLDLRRSVQDRLYLHGPDAARTLLAAIESLVDMISVAPERSAAVATSHGAVADRDDVRGRSGRQPHHLRPQVATGVLQGLRTRGPDAQHADVDARLNGVQALCGRGVVGDEGVARGVGLHGSQDVTHPEKKQDSLSIFTSLFYARARALADLLLLAESVEVVPGSRPVRRVRRSLLAGRDADDVAREALAAALPPPGPSPRRALLRSARGSTPKPPWRTRGKAARLAAAATGGTGGSPEQARERLAAWVAKVLELRGASGSGLLAALRHGAPVFVQVGSGGDDDEDSQGTDGAGGAERAAAVLAAPDDFAEAEDEQEDAQRWGRALAALTTLRASGDGDMRGPEMAEIIRRHHGLDSIAEGTQGAGGESFVSIGESGLACSGRTLAKESVRKIYNRAIAVLRRMAEGDERPDLGEQVRDEPSTRPPPLSPEEAAKRVPRPPGELVDAMHDRICPTSGRLLGSTPVRIPARRDEAWESFRAQADAVAW